MFRDRGKQEVRGSGESPSGRSSRSDLGVLARQEAEREKRMQQITERYQWLTEKMGSGVKDYAEQGRLDRRWARVQEALSRRDDAKLREISYDFGKQMAIEMIKVLTDNHEWLCKHAVKKRPKLNKRYLDQQLSRAKDAFTRTGNLELIEGIYEEFKFFMGRTVAGRYANWGAKNIDHEEVDDECLSAVWNYEQQGSHPSPIDERSDEGEPQIPEDNNDQG